MFNQSVQPYQWSNMEDTRFLLSRFQRDSQTLDTGESEEEEESTKSSALKPEHIVGYAYGGQRPHGDEEHVENPNVVIIHRENGLEVLSLLSGECLNIYGSTDLAHSSVTEVIFSTLRLVILLCHLSLGRSVNDVFGNYK